MLPAVLSITARKVLMYSFYLGEEKKEKEKANLLLLRSSTLGVAP